MRILEELRPTKQRRLMDLVEQAGLDVRDWADCEGGEAMAASNPRFCHEWAFSQEHCPVVLTLLHAHLMERDGEVIWSQNPRTWIDADVQPGAQDAWRRRVRHMDECIRHAHSIGLPVRVVVIGGDARDVGDAATDSSAAIYRLLDPATWVISSYDEETGDCILQRRAPKRLTEDQFIVASPL